MTLIPLLPLLLLPLLIIMTNTHLNLWLVVTCTGCCTWLHTLGVRPPVRRVLALDEDESNKYMNKSDAADLSRNNCSVSELFDYRELSAADADAVVAAAAAWLCVWDAAPA